jgi:CRISPR/Cas system-associated exonuclease Cas4 (RecB family)
MGFSHSSIKAYEQCPYKYKLTRIEHRQEPSGPAAERGKLIHSELEHAITGIGILPQQHLYWLPYINELREKKTQCETEFAIKRNWTSCSFKDPDYWIRGIYDAVYYNGTHAHVLDWKSGKERDYGDQLKLYALIIMVCNPEIEKVTTEICYTDLEKRTAYDTYIRSQLDELKTWLSDRVAKIENDDIFAPKPDYGCRWCHFRKSNGGPCQW